MSNEPMARRDDVDWLRVVATYLLFPFHTAMVFNPAPFYHIRNDELSFGMLVFSGFISLWHMPLFFLLAGWSLVGSLRARGTPAFLGERVRRLLVPLVAGCALFGPVIKYLELRTGLDASYAGLRVSPALQAGFRTVIPSGLDVAPPFDERFVDFLPTFFTHASRFTWAHLWFVAYLLTFTLLYLPLFTWLLRRPVRTDRVAAGWVYLPIVPLALVQVFLRPHWPGLQNLYDDWANVAYYGVYLWAGFLLARSPALERAVHDEWRRALAIGVATTLGLLLAVLGVIKSPAIVLAGSAVAGWCFVVALLGVARRFLDVATPALRWLAESAFPVYVLHQVTIVVLGYYLVLPLPLGVATKFALLLAASVLVTLGVYQYVVRPLALPRFLLGMKPRVCPLKRPLVVQATSALLVVGLVLAAGAGRAASPLGLWYAEGGAAQVAIERCGGALCGRVIWLRSPFDERGCDLRDRYNPDAGLRDRSLVGLELLRGVTPTPDPDGTLRGGVIYDPTSGRTYRCLLRLDGDDRLELRGYIGLPIIGRTTTWLRVGAEERLCREDSR
jgi:uncharacterized protein (DUF2147 family)